MIIVNIKGSKEHVFEEGSGYVINYANKAVNLKKSVHRLYNHSEHYKVKLQFDFIDSVKKTINEQRHNQEYKNSISHISNPFHDTVNSLKEVKLNTSILRQNIGYYDKNEEFLKLDAKEYNDFDKLDLKEFVFLSEDNVQNYVYPIRFNSSSYHRRGGKISILNQVDNITLNSFGVDKLKGFRGFATNHGQNALKENIRIENYVIKNEDSNVFFEDGVLEGYLFNKDKKLVLDEVNVLYNPQTKVSTNTFSYRESTKISSEPRYTQLQQQKIFPFKDYNNNKNNPFTINDDQIFYNKLSDSDLNDIILNNRTIFNTIEEAKLYKSFGKITDYSINNGLESITFHEGLD